MATPAELRIDEFLNAKLQEEALNLDAARRVDAENRRIEENLRAFGEEPPPEFRESALSRFFDTLDTPRQAIAGPIAKLVGVPEYQDLGILEASELSREQNLRTGDILRKMDILTSGSYAQNAARGFLGFFGDVLTDPITYVNPLGNFAKVGGLNVSKTKTLGETGKTASELMQQARTQSFPRVMTEKLSDLGLKPAADIDAISKLDPSDARSIADFIAKNSGLKPDDPLVSSMVGDIFSQTAKEAEAPFKQIRLLRERLRDTEAAGLYDVIGDEYRKNIDRLANKAASQLGIEDYTRGLAGFDDIIEKPRIQLSGPLAGAEIFGRLPLLGAREIDIPVISDISEKLYQRIGQAYYGAPLKLKNFVVSQQEATAKALAENPGSKLLQAEEVAWNTAASLGKFLDGAAERTAKAASLVSNRIAASGRIFGSRAKADTIRESAISSGLLYNKTFRDTAFIARKILKEEDADDIFKDVYRTIESFKVKPSKPGLDDLDAGALAYQKALESLRMKYNTRRPGFGDDVVETTIAIQRAFDNMLEKELQLNAFGGGMAEAYEQGLTNGYAYHMYRTPEGMGPVDDNVVKNIMKNAGISKAGDFTFLRSIESARQAKAVGLLPDENIFNSLLTRTYWSRRLEAEREFAERFAYQLALPQRQYEVLKSIALDVSNERSAEALNVARRLGLTFKESEAGGEAIIRTSRGTPVNSEVYNNWRDIVQKGAGTPEEIELVQQELNFIQGRYGRIFQFTDEEASGIKELDDLIIAAQQAKLGREGESVFTRAGAATLEDTQYRALKNLSRDEKRFWGGYLPRSFVNAYDESIRGVKSLKAVAQRLKESDPDSVLYSAVAKVASGAEWFRRVMQKSLTQYWPAYWVGNLYGAQMQAMNAVSTLGEALNVGNLLRNHKLLKGNIAEISETGEKLTSAMLNAEMLNRGIDPATTAHVESLMDTVGDYLMLHSDEAQNIMKNFRGLDKMTSKQAREARSFMAKLGDGISDFAQKMQNFGYQQAYVNLRRRGFSPDSAAAEASKALVDYANGKTQFERVAMNNLIFFYSFSRGNASNMFMALMSRPGALSTQLHAHKAVAEMMTDPNNYNLEEDVIEKMNSIRGQMALSTYLGENPETGMSRMLVNTRMPVEDLGRYLTAIPKIRGGSSTWKDIINIVGEGAQNTVQTAFQQANPALKFVVEGLISEKNTFFNRPINDETIRKVAGMERSVATLAPFVYNRIPEYVWRGIDEATASALGGRINPDGTYTIDPFVMLVLTNLTPLAGRLMNTIQAATDPGRDIGDRISRAIGGINVQELDAEDSIIFNRNRELKEDASFYNVPLGKRRALLRASLMQDEEE